MGKTVSGVLGLGLGEGADAPPSSPAPPLPAPTGPPQALGQDGPDGPRPPAPADAGQEPPVSHPAATAQQTDAPPATEPAPPAAGLSPSAAEHSGQVAASDQGSADQPVSGQAPEPGSEPERPREPDAMLAAAVELALEAAREVGGAAVGDHLGAEADGPTGEGPVVTHSFASTDPAYVGWRWAVTVARAEGGEHVTVDEVVLLPGSGALLAKAWVPWSERVQAGDLSAGDLLPPPADDERLVPSYADTTGLAEDEAAQELALADAVRLELGLGRPRVLSREGRLDAAERWWDGEAGPDTPVARQAPGRCGGCGFLVPLAGALGAAFGVCANAYAPDDGRVVALAHGCGAHSETVVEAPHATTAGMAVEDDEFELVPVVSEPASEDDGS